MAKIILMDWQRGKIPYFVQPPNKENYLDTNKNVIEIENQNEKVIKFPYNHLLLISTA